MRAASLQGFLTGCGEAHLGGRSSGLGTEYGPKASFSSCSKNRLAGASLLIPVSIKKRQVLPGGSELQSRRAEIVENN